MVGAPKVIAIDYHDGPAEGLADTIGDLRWCYFKLIAWDKNQDNRLYVVNEVNRDIYARVVELLTRNQKPPSTSVWLPQWKNMDKEDKQEMNQLLNTCSRSLNQPQYLVFSEDVMGQVNEARDIKNDNDLRKRVAEVLKAGKPDNLINWG